MAYQKRYRTVVPVPRDQGADEQALIWLARESFERQAASDALTIVEFVDLGEVAAVDIPPTADRELGRPAAEFVWRVFEGAGERA